MRLENFSIILFVFLTLVATSTIIPRIPEELNELEIDVSPPTTTVTDAPKTETTTSTTASATTATMTEVVNFKKAFINLFRNPLIPASFMNPLSPRNSPICDSKKGLSKFVEMGDTEVIIEEIPSPQVENKIREITNTFIETLKHDRSWFVSLLFQIRKEQKRRESQECSAAECIYKIPCYLSQRFLALSVYSEVVKQARVREGFDLLRRRRRSLEGMEIDERYTSVIEEGKAPVTNCTGIFANYCYNSIACIYVNVLESAACA